MRACALIPAYDAERSVGPVVRAALERWPEPGAVIIVDDGSSDRTGEVALAAGARVLTHPRNLGKGAALRTGMAAALAAGFEVAVTIDADGQHPVGEAARLLEAGDAEAMVLGIRDLVAAGAPRSNQISNRISNFFLSLFAGRAFADTQCGLRRYPLARTLDLDAKGDGYAFEAEVILRAVAAGLRIVEVPVTVLYPDERERVTHFDSVRDPARIVVRVLHTLAVTRGLRRAPRAATLPAAAALAADRMPDAGASAEAPRSRRESARFDRRGASAP